MEQILFNVNDINKPVPIPNSELPSDFPFYTITGASDYDGEFYVTPHTTATHQNNYIFVMNNLGQVLKYKKIEHQAYDFKKVLSSQGKTRYTYLDVISSEEPTVGGVQFYENSELVVLDENFNEIDRVRCNQAGEIPEDYPSENHFSLYIDDGHYIIATYFRPDGSQKYENSIQELKWNRVVFHWETNDSPELASLSHTSPTTDYAHINAMNIDYDENFVISFRNIGLVKLNRTTKEIMWVIGRERNDFTGLDSSNIPFQQHDIRIYKGDGSVSVFDNFGHTSNSRICRYYLNETTMQCEKFIEYLTTETRSQYMGSAQLIDDEKSIWDITYGSGWNYGFEEYDFTQNKQLMKLKFNDGYDLYNVIRDRDNLTSSFAGDAVKTLANKTELLQSINEANSLSVDMYTEPTWTNMQTQLNSATIVYNDYSATQVEVDTATLNLNTAIEALEPIAVPVATYSLSNEVFNGDRVVDTEVKMFDEPKDFSFIVKCNKSGGTIPTSEYRTMIHCMHEVSPWDGLTVQTFGTTGSIDTNLDTARRFVYQSGSVAINSNDIYFLCYRRRSDGSMMCEYYNESGELTDSEAFNSTYIDNADLKVQSLYIGGADMVSEFDRYFVGTVHNFNYYNSYLSDAERKIIIQSLVT